MAIQDDRHTSARDEAPKLHRIKTREEVERESGEERVVRTFCRPNCQGGCPIFVHVRDGKVVKTSMAPLPDEKYSRICLRGLTHPQQMYSERRLTHPMKRVGERGSGQWERISWDEAIEMVADKFKDVIEEHGSRAVAYTMGSGNYGILTSTHFGATSRFFAALEATTLSSTLDVGAVYGHIKVFGDFMPNDPADVVNSDAIFVIGANVTEAQIHMWHFIADAIEGGSKLYVVDPVFTATASKAHEWIRLRPGSDGAMFLSMMNVIFAEGLENKQFIHDSTVGPFLVRSDDGKFLRRSHLTGEPVTQVGANPRTGQPYLDDPYMVWSLEKEDFVEVGPDVQAAVTGTFDFNGITVRPALDLLKDAVAEYTPEFAEEITLIPPAALREMAITYAKAKAATMYHFMGIDHWDNTHMTGFAMGALVAITGNIGKPGGSLGWKWYFAENLDFVKWLFPDGKHSRDIFTDDMFETAKTGEIMGKPDPIKALYVSGCNPLGAYTDRNHWVNEVLPTIDFIVTVDIFNSDTVEYSDLVLPAAHWFEREDIQFANNHPFVVYGDKAVEPLGESKPDIDILRLLAKPLGIEKYIPETNDEVYELSLNEAWAERQGFSFDELKREGSFKVRYESGSDEPNVGGIGYGKFITASGRAEFYNEAPWPRVMSTTSLQYRPDEERIPRFFPPLEAWPGTEAHAKYPLVFFQEHVRWRVHTQYAEVAWLRELDPEPTVKINPHDAEARGIKAGDVVEIFNDRGHVVVKALLTTALPEGMLSLPKGWLTHQHISGSPCELTHMKLHPASINQSYFDVAVDVRLWEGAS